MKLVVKEPCSADWNGMSGTEARRFCDHCDKHVHDLSLYTEEEAQALLATPGVCARFRTDAAGDVRFRPSHLSAAAMVMAAVLTAAPAQAGGRAADPEAQGWGEWLVDWVLSVGPTQGEIEPVPQPPPPQHPPVLMGAVAPIQEPATEIRIVHNLSPATVEVRCDWRRARVEPGETLEILAPEGTECTSMSQLKRAQWSSAEVTCEVRENRLVCE
ncbi:MAG: hypothetical protein R3F61_21765 [Myxococcota bacterium]